MSDRKFACSHEHFRLDSSSEMATILPIMFFQLRTLQIHDPHHRQEIVHK